jgi:hypothetical protein
MERHRCKKGSGPGAEILGGDLLPVISLSYSFTSVHVTS